MDGAMLRDSGIVSLSLGERAEKTAEPSPLCKPQRFSDTDDFQGFSRKPSLNQDSEGTQRHPNGYLTGPRVLQV